MEEKECVELFKELSQIDFRGRMFDKQGLSYIPWATELEEVMKRHKVRYNFHLFPEKGDSERLVPYNETRAGIYVATDVTICGETKEMVLPVMDGANRSMSFEERKGMTARGKEFTVQPATMTDINKSLLRCLTKNLAVFGAGLNLWYKEDASESILEVERLVEECLKYANQRAALSDNAKKKVEDACKSTLPEECNGDPRLCEDADTLRTLKKKLLAVRK